MKWIRSFIQKMKSENREKGAIVAEATIALTAFIFALYIILSLANISYVQMKMGVALNSTAKQMSQYAYLYETLNLSTYMSGTGGKSSAFMGSFAQVLNAISRGTALFSPDISSMFATGASKAEGDGMAEYLKNGVGMALARELMKKNLVEFEGDSAEAFLKRCHVKDGLGGLSFLNTTFLSNSNQNEIELVVTYEVEVVRLLGSKYTFNFIQRAKTKAWGKGVSLRGSSSEDSTANSGGNSTENTKKSIWEESNLVRGNSIITSVKKGYEYTSSSYNFHAFEAAKNQFVRIRSLDVTDPSFANNPGAIESAIKQTYETLQKGVSGLEVNIPVVNSAGKDVTVTSDPNSRKFKVVLVVPDNADLDIVDTAMKNFQASHPDVFVEVKIGYGAANNDQTSQGDT